MAKYAFGVDVGGTTVKMGFFTSEGELLKKWEIKTRTEDNGKYVLPDIADAIHAELKERNLATADLEGVGIGVPGPVLRSGVVDECVNLGWGVIDVKNDLSALIDGVKVEVANDANAAALGEYWKGGGRGFKNMVMLTLGTGVGGAVIIDGRILPGAHGAGGELGHITVDPNADVVCACGRRGCLEQYCSANGITRVVNEKLPTIQKPSALKKADKINAKVIFDAAQAGDAVAMDFVDDFGHTLGAALSTISTVIDPDVYVIGGGVSRSGDIVIDAIRKHYEETCFHSCKTTAFKIAELENDAGIYGTVKMVL